jgi:hypothetical protein
MRMGHTKFTGSGRMGAMDARSDQFEGSRDAELELDFVGS